MPWEKEPPSRGDYAAVRFGADQDQTLQLGGSSRLVPLAGLSASPFPSQAQLFF